MSVLEDFKNKFRVDFYSAFFLREVFQEKLVSNVP